MYTIARPDQTVKAPRQQIVYIVCFRWTTHKPVIGNATIKLEIISVAVNEKFEPLVRKLDYVSMAEYT